MSSELKGEYSLSVEGELVGVKLKSSIDVDEAVLAGSGLSGLGHVLA